MSRQMGFVTLCSGETETASASSASSEDTQSFAFLVHAIGSVPMVALPRHVNRLVATTE